MSLNLEEGNPASVLEIEAFAYASKQSPFVPNATIAEVRKVEAICREQMGYTFVLAVQELASSLDKDPKSRLLDREFLKTFHPLVRDAIKARVSPFALAFLLVYCAHKERKSEKPKVDLSRFMLSK